MNEKIKNAAQLYAVGAIDCYQLVAVVGSVGYKKSTTKFNRELVKALLYATEYAEEYDNYVKAAIQVAITNK